MTSYPMDAETGGSAAGSIHRERIREAEEILLNCVADFGSDSGEAFTAEWHLREVQRQALRNLPH